MKVVWSNRAAAEFEKCISFIEIDSTVNAERWAIRIFEKISSLADFPELGKLSRNLPNMRELVLEKNFIAYYRIVKDKCRIMSFRRVSQVTIK